MSSRPLVLAIDAGTSSVRALAYDERGQAVPGLTASAAQTLHTTVDGGVELDADDMVEKILGCVDAVLSQAGTDAAWRGVGVSTFWHSVVGVDAEGRAATPILTWADTRCRAAVADLKKKLDANAVHERTGCLVHESYVPGKLLWYGADRAARWMSPGEYLFLCLFGKAACSLSMASATGLYNQIEWRWDADVLAACGVSQSQLSDVPRRLKPKHGLLAPYRTRLAALADIPWLPAVGDGACSNVGCGAISAQRVAVMLGTSGAVRRMTAAFPTQVAAGLWRYALDDRHWVVGGALSNGGNVYEWVQKTFRLPDDAELMAGALSPDSHGLTVLPFLAGERSPGWRGDARAAFTGLSLDTRPEAILRAAMESVAYSIADICEPLGVTEVVATGGGLLHSSLWVRIVTDVLGVPVIVSGEAEASSRGVALLVLEGLGMPPALDSVPADDARRELPNAGAHARYALGRARERTLYARLF